MHDPDETYIDPKAFLGGPKQGFAVTSDDYGYYAAGDCPQCGAADQGGYETGEPKEDPPWAEGDMSPSDGGADGGAAGGKGYVRLKPEAIWCACACGSGHGVKGAENCGASWWVAVK